MGRDEKSVTFSLGNLKRYCLVGLVLGERVVFKLILKKSVNHIK